MIIHTSNYDLAVSNLRSVNSLVFVHWNYDLALSSYAASPLVCPSFVFSRHSGFSPLCPGKSWLWLFLLGLYFGGSAFRPLWFVFVVFCAIDFFSWRTPEEKNCLCFFSAQRQMALTLVSISTFHMPHDSVIAGFWIVSMNLWECCPCGLHSVILRLLTGVLVSALCRCYFLAHRLLYGFFVVCCYS